MTISRLLSILAALCATIFMVEKSAVAQPAPRGKYYISRLETLRVTPPGAVLPPCQPSANKYLAQFRGKVIEYNTEVFVNGTKWSLQRCLSNCDTATSVVAALPDPPQDVSLTVWFKLDKGKSRGFFLYERLDDKGAEICSDAIGFSGPFLRTR